MSIPVICPGCSSTATVPDRAAGRRARCPRCRTKFTVPLPVARRVDVPTARRVRESLPILRPVKPRGRSWLLLPSIAVLITLAFVLALLFKPNGPILSELPPDHTLSAQDLFDDYCNGEHLADSRYKGCRLELEGYVANVSRNKNGRYLVFAVSAPSRGFERSGDTYRRIALASSSGRQGVLCYIPEDAHLPNDCRAVVRGRCVGMPLDVVLVDCIVVSATPMKRR